MIGRRKGDLPDAMQIKITGKNLDIGEALRSRIESRLASLRQKYFEGTVHCHVTVEKGRTGFRCDSTLHLATGLVLHAHGEDGDAARSFEATAAHLEKQLRRYKRRLKDHHRARSEPVRQFEAASYVIEAPGEEDESETGDLNPVVVADMPSSVPELSVGEAVMQLDISTLPFVLFRNARGGHINLVYRRNDGNIGWIDPQDAGRSDS
jgi:ribosomal subunit interface protein